jgi:hypothetical protein
MKSALLLFLAAGMALGAEAPINRHALVTRHNLEWNNLAGQIPLGNGEFCFNADATGLQTFGGSTMSHWAWHSAPLPPGCTPADLPPTGTVEKGRITGPMRKASEHRELDGWMFRNPHPINLGRLRFLRSTGAVLEPKEIGSISRRYDLWTGMHTSRFEVDGQPVVAETCVHPTLDLIAVHAESPLLRDGKLVVALDFPYPSANNSSRWTGDKRPVIRSSSFMAPARLPGGAPMERPVFLTGYGHFSQVVSDMEKWPDYGVNIIQIELGPSRVFPNEGRTDEAPVRELSRMLDRAQKSGVAVCLLISPHYLPGWALEKWPQLRQRREGFLRYCLHAPEGRELLRRFILTALAPIKDHPALHSICLSNEPVNEEEPCEPARQQWRTWLEKRHGAITALNSLCGANFTAFAEVPLPNPFGPRPAPALWMDYIRFNQEFFADWHRMLAGGDNVLARDEYGRERRPELPAADKLPFRHSSTSSRKLHEGALAELSAWHLRPTLELREAGQQLAWGVEWRSAETGEGTVADLCNYRKEPVTAVLMRDGQPVAAQDVLTGRQVDAPLTLAPLEVRLLKLR